MDFNTEIMIYEYLNEQTFKCPNCSSKFKSKWKDMVKCKKCGASCEKVNEAPIAAKGWTKKSIEKFGKTIGKSPTEKGFFNACVKRMNSKMGDKSKGFCASIKDAAYGSPNWRGKGKSEKKVKLDTKRDKFSRQLPSK